MPLTFESWMPNRPNVKEHNQDDCAMMDCQKHHCDWLDVPCTDDVADHKFNISFICQKSHEETKTTTTPVSTTPFFPGSRINIYRYGRFSHSYGFPHRSKII